MIKKLEIYGVNTTNLAWFASYLNGRKQYIKINESADSVKKNIKYEVPQGSILGQLLFLLYVNDLPNSISNVQMSNNVCRRYYFFCEYSNINTSFKTVNDELIKVNDLFSTNKLSLNDVKKQVFIDPQIRQKYSILSHLPFLKTNNHYIERGTAIKFLSILLDDNLSWKEHTKYLENKIAKNIGLIYRTKPFLDKESLLALHYCCIHSYLNCANLAWGCTNLVNLKKTTQPTKALYSNSP